MADLKEFCTGAELIPTGTGDGAALNGRPFRTGFHRFGRRPSYNSGFRTRQLLTTGNIQVTLLLP